MANKHRDTTLIDPLFAIPIGAEEEFERSRDYGDPDDEFSEEYGDGYVEDDSDDNEEDELEAPSQFEVVKQKIIRDGTGSDDVDVVIKTNTIAGAINYEIKVTKV